MEKEDVASRAVARGPDLRRYSSLGAFLTDYFEFRKIRNPRFTYEIWAAELGFKSTAIMYLICKGKRSLTATSARRLSAYLNLSEQDYEFLLLLAHHQQNSLVEIKNAIFDKILEQLKYDETHLTAEQYATFVLSPTMPLIRMILSYDDTVGTKEEISEILNISRSRLDEDLVALESMGFIENVSDKGQGTLAWKSSAKALRFPDIDKSEIMDQLHIHTLKESIGIVGKPDLFKKLRTLILAIDPVDHCLLEEEIDQFICKLKNKFAYNTLSKKQLIKVNLQTYQVSKTKRQGL